LATKKRTMEAIARMGINLTKKVFHVRCADHTERSCESLAGLFGISGHQPVQETGTTSLSGGDGIQRHSVVENGMVLQTPVVAGVVYMWLPKARYERLDRQDAKLSQGEGRRHHGPNRR